MKQVLSFARGVEGARVSVHLKHIIAEIERIVANTFPKNIVFERETARDLFLVTGDPTQLNQVLLNLVVNARDAMPGGGRLEISARNTEIDEQYAVMNHGIKAGSYVVIEVTDTGEGMSKEVAERGLSLFSRRSRWVAARGWGCPRCSASCAATAVS